jgi:hypothetical protein
MVTKYKIDAEGDVVEAVGDCADPLFVRWADYEQLEREIAEREKSMTQYYDQVEQERMKEKKFWKSEVDRYEDLIKKIDNEKNELALKLGEIKKALIEVVRVAKDK